MAETKRMTSEQVVGYLLEGEGLDFLRESLSWVVQQLMEAEVSELVGAERGERAPEERLTHRNGYRARRWDTRAGELELAIPKLRRGSYFPSFLEPRRRSEQALVSVVQEAYVAGVSTRKVDQVVESLGLRISKSEVSRICASQAKACAAEKRTRSGAPAEGAARFDVSPACFAPLDRAEVEQKRRGGPSPGRTHRRAACRLLAEVQSGLIEQPDVLVEGDATIDVDPPSQRLLELLTMSRELEVGLGSLQPCAVTRSGRITARRRGCCCVGCSACVQ